MRAAVFAVLLVLTLTMALASLFWSTSLRRFLRLLRERYPDSFHELGQPTVWGLQSSLGALPRTLRLYRFIETRSAGDSVPRELQAQCRRLRRVLIFWVSAVTAFVIALVLVAIMFPHGREI